MQKPSQQTYNTPQTPIGHVSTIAESGIEQMLTSLHNQTQYSHHHRPNRLYIKHEDMTETVILSNDSNSGDLHSFDVHQPTLTGFLTVFAFAITTIILYKCYQRRCFRCWHNTFFPKRELLPRGTHSKPTRSATVQDDSTDEGYCP